MGSRSRFTKQFHRHEAVSRSSFTVTKPFHEAVSPSRSRFTKQFHRHEAVSRSNFTVTKPFHEAVSRAVSRRHNRPALATPHWVGGLGYLEAVFPERDRIHARNL